MKIETSETIDLLNNLIETPQKIPSISSCRRSPAATRNNARTSRVICVNSSASSAAIPTNTPA
jgi:hypothetical protein